MAVAAIGCFLEMEIFHGKPDAVTVNQHLEGEVSRLFDAPETVDVHADKVSIKWAGFHKVHIQAEVTAALKEPLYADVSFLDEAKKAGDNATEFDSYVQRAQKLPSDLAPTIPGSEPWNAVTVATPNGTKFVYDIDCDAKRENDSWTFSSIRPQVGSVFPNRPSGVPAKTETHILILGTDEAKHAILAFIQDRQHFEDQVKSAEVAYAQKQEQDKLAQQKADVDAKVAAAAQVEADRKAAQVAADQKAAAQTAQRDKIIALLKSGPRFRGNLTQAGDTNSSVIDAKLAWDDNSQQVTGWVENVSLSVKKSLTGKIVSDDQGQPALQLEETGIIEKPTNTGIFAPAPIVGIIYSLAPESIGAGQQLSGSWKFQQYSGTMAVSPLSVDEQLAVAKAEASTLVNASSPTENSSNGNPLANTTLSTPSSHKRPTSHSHLYYAFDLKTLPAGKPADSWIYGDLLGFNRTNDTLMCCAMKAGGFIRGYSTEVDIQYPDGMPDLYKNIPFPYNPIDGGISVPVKKEMPLHILSISYWDGANAAGYRAHNVKVVVEWVWPIAGNQGQSSALADSQTLSGSSSTTSPSVTTNEYPSAIPIPDKPGFVTSPYAPNQVPVDVRGYPSGSTVRCPYTNKIFVIP